MTPDFWSKAKRELAKQDPVLAKIMKRYKGEILKSKGDAFETLARSIVGQQISVKAAESIWQKLLKASPKPTPIKISKMKPEKLRSCGLSARKVEYLKDLAMHFLDKRIQPELWTSHSDEQIIIELVNVKGIGRWTAEMFLIFHLLRPDVFPTADLGLQKALSLHYGHKYPIPNKQLKSLSRKFSPWSSVAVWYLWRSLDPIPVEY